MAASYSMCDKEKISTKLGQRPHVTQYAALQWQQASLRAGSCGKQRPKWHSVLVGPSSAFSGAGLTAPTRGAWQCRTSTGVAPSALMYWPYSSRHTHKLGCKVELSPRNNENEGVAKLRLWSFPHTAKPIPISDAPATLLEWPIGH